MTLPRLVLVSGTPASGKTTIAHSLGGRIQLPVVSRDEIKEGLVHTAPQRPPTWGGPIAQEAFALFRRIVREYVRSGCSVVAEAAFRIEWSHDLTDLLRESDARIVHCHVDRSVARQRFIDRADTDPLRLRAHPDWEIVKAMDTGTFDWDGFEPMDWRSQS